MTAVFSPVDHPDLRKPGIVEAEKKKMNSIARSKETSGDVPRGFVREMALIGEAGVLGERIIYQITKVCTTNSKEIWEGN
jgi:hypothetical protein